MTFKIILKFKFNQLKFQNFCLCNFLIWRCHVRKIWDSRFNAELGLYISRKSHKVALFTLLNDKYRQIRMLLKTFFSKTMDISNFRVLPTLFHVSNSFLCYTYLKLFNVFIISIDLLFIIAVRVLKINNFLFPLLSSNCIHKHKRCNNSGTLKHFQSQPI